MTTGSGSAMRPDAAQATIIPSCTERDFFETIYPFGRFGAWSCVYCGEPIEYRADGTVFVGRGRLECRVEDLGGYHQLSPKNAAPGAANRCCSDRIARADEVVPLGRTIRCPICGDSYTSAMVERWQGSSHVKGYVREGREGAQDGDDGYAVDHELPVPALVPVERLSSRPR